MNTELELTRLDMAAPVKQGLGLVQYIALRSDLLRAEGWPVGALVAQACHASTAVLHLHRDDPSTGQYLANLDSMHKVVLEVSSETELKSLAKTLESEGLQFKLWVEQPEGYPTCLATKPYPKSSVQTHFRKLKLFK